MVSKFVRRRQIWSRKSLARSERAPSRGRKRLMNDWLPDIEVTRLPGTRLAPPSRMDTARGVWTICALLLFTSAIPGRLVAQSHEAERLREAAVVFEEVMGAPDKAIPRTILGNAVAIAVFPGTVKGGFVFGAHRGRGVISVRHPTHRTWSAPAFLTLTGGSFGAQIGAQSIDLVLVIMNRRGLEQLLRNQFKLGADASVAAGPLGRDVEASTDLQMRAQILSYSRTRGLFAGVSLKGSAIRQDPDANERFYGQRHRTRDLVLDGQGTTPRTPAALARWYEILTRYGR